MRVSPILLQMHVEAGAAGEKMRHIETTCHPRVSARPAAALLLAWQLPMQGAQRPSGHRHPPQLSIGACKRIVKRRLLRQRRQAARVLDSVFVHIDTAGRMEGTGRLQLVPLFRCSIVRRPRPSRSACTQPRSGSWPASAANTAHRIRLAHLARTSGVLYSTPRTKGTGACARRAWCAEHGSARWGAAPAARSQLAACSWRLHAASRLPPTHTQPFTRPPIHTASQPQAQAHLHQLEPPFPRRQHG